MGKQGSADGADPSKVLATIDRALERGDHAGALHLAIAGCEAHPRSADLHHARGVALRGLERPDEALEAFSEACELDPDLPDGWLDAAEILLDELGDDARALDLLAIAARRLGESGDLLLLRGLALSHLEDLTGALEVLDRAVRLDPDSADAHVERSAILVELLRLEEAEQAVERALELDPEHSRAHHLTAFVLDYTGRRELAARHFRRAAALDPDLSPRPPRLSERQFDAVVQRAIGALPEDVRRHLENVEVATENYADREFCRHHDCSPLTLGLYVGTPLPLRDGGQTPQLPDRILLFQRALENGCADEAELIEEIGVTLKHEVGHLLGFEEDDLAERGYE